MLVPSRPGAKTLCELRRHHTGTKSWRHTDPPKIVGVMAARSTLIDLGLLFGRLGTVAFGGPAAHIAMMRDEVVTRRQWLTDREFLDLVAATHLIPGPNSTELAIHIGSRRGGWPGLLVAGIAFILPASLIVTALAWAYVTFGARPDAKALFFGIGPAVIAIVAHALWGMSKSAVTSVWLLSLGMGALVAVLFGVHELLVLFGAAVVGLVGRLSHGPRATAGALIGAMIAVPRGAGAWAIGMAAGTMPVTLGGLFGVFLKTGAVLFGSGYVLLAFLRADLVDRLGWLTEGQLVDAIAIGQFTPGPVFTTATFVGYLLAGPAGAVVATVGIFIPAFCYVAISAPLVQRLRTSRALGGILDAVVVASLALMAVVTWQLARVSIVDTATTLIALVSLTVLLTTRVNSAWLIAAGAIAGFILKA